MSQFIEMFGNPVTNTKGWKTAKIKDVAPEMPSKEQLSGKIWLLNLDMIESNTGRIIEKVYEDVESALSVQSFDEGNVLFSKLRPYLNKVVIPDEHGMATTELVPLRPDPSKLHKIFLSHLLRGNQFVNYANDIAGGTKMPRMPLTELRNFDCILPPMDKQLEFVFIAEQADKSKFGDFKSQFIEMFKDLPVNGTISDLTEGAPTSVKKTYGYEDMIEYIDISSIDSTSKTVQETSKHFVGKAPSRAQQCVKNGDILVSTVRPVNRNIAVIDNDIHNLVASTGFCVLRPKEGYRDYLLSIVTSDLYTEKMCDKASGGLYPAVNNSDVLNYGIHIPDEGLANRVSIIYKQADKSKSIIQKAMVYLNDIHSDILSRTA